MPWQTLPNVKGKVYIPEFSDKIKKYPCKDCFECQSCSQERCHVCRQEKKQAKSNAGG